MRAADRRQRISISEPGFGGRGREAEVILEASTGACAAIISTVQRQSSAVIVGAALQTDVGALD